MCADYVKCIRFKIKNPKDDTWKLTDNILYYQIMGVDRLPVACRENVNTMIYVNGDGMYINFFEDDKFTWRKLDKSKSFYGLDYFDFRESKLYDVKFVYRNEQGEVVKVVE